MSSGAEALDQPAAIVTPIAEAIVQPGLLALPELDLFVAEEESTPVIGARDLGSFREALLRPAQALVKARAVGQRPALG